METLKTRFSPRQQDILFHLSNGCSNDEIAKKMGIKPATVAFHFHILFIKTETSTRNQLLVKYLQQKFY